MIRRGELAICHHEGWVILAHVDIERRVSIAVRSNDGNLYRFGWFSQVSNEVINHAHWLKNSARRFETVRHGVTGRSLRRLSDDEVLYLMGLPTPLRKRLLWSARGVLRKVTRTHESNSGATYAIRCILAVTVTSAALLAMTLIVLHIVK